MKKQITENAKLKIEELDIHVKQASNNIFLKATLCQTDAIDEWQKVDKQCEHFKFEAGQASNEAKGAPDNVSASSKLLGEEIINSFKRIQKKL